MTTGYNIREGSEELARRRRQRTYRDLDLEVAVAMLKRLPIDTLARMAVQALPAEPARAAFHPESRRV